MAQRTVVHLEDDLDGGTADETVSFALDGSTYEIDLSTANAAKLRDSLAPFVGASRRPSGQRGGARRSTPQAAPRRTSGPGKTNEIRSWARENGFTVNDRGRISSQVVNAYNEAH